MYVFPLSLAFVCKYIYRYLYILCNQYLVKLLVTLGPSKAQYQFLIRKCIANLDPLP